ncbi:hypothetical protein OG897_16325 [Streptomyces sp. NBC_00237]|uniref:hypothetical protein n=1 Tax=Streptomyces sp. NBC_00237 TaxID=2975687 RepID=UPI00225B546B|nr:hypothetical protein [Streptomyces sp. NBC_00237]MCX5203008.1 hypothetical protein [Streptomyces sp. NBC_00237]
MANMTRNLVDHLTEVFDGRIDVVRKMPSEVSGLDLSTPLLFVKMVGGDTTNNRVLLERRTFALNLFAEDYDAADDAYHLMESTMYGIGGNAKLILGPYEIAAKGEESDFDDVVRYGSSWTLTDYR